MEKKFYNKKLWNWKKIQSAKISVNGKYCSSGFAYKSATNTAKWATITKIVTDLGTQTSPYKWTATNTANTCNYYYDSSNYVSSYCEWGLDGSSGYWPMPGSTELSSYVTYRKAIDLVNFCHTLDRDNYLRLQQSCLVGSDSTYTTAWTNSASMSFNVSYWPFIQGSTVSTWMYNVMYFSPSQMTKSISSLSPPMIIVYKRKMNLYECRLCEMRTALIMVICFSSHFANSDSMQAKFSLFWCLTSILKRHVSEKFELYLSMCPLWNGIN